MADSSIPSLPSLSALTQIEFPYILARQWIIARRGAACFNLYLVRQLCLNPLTCKSVSVPGRQPMPPAKGGSYFPRSLCIYQALLLPGSGNHNSSPFRAGFAPRVLWQ